MRKNVVWLFIFILFVCYGLAFAKECRFVVLNKQFRPLTSCFDFVLALERKNFTPRLFVVSTI